jgi:hypothetical protein
VSSSGPCPIQSCCGGVPVDIGSAVLVVSATDETFDDKFLGQMGAVVELDYVSGCGQSYPDDPMIRVRFSDGTVDSFWIEEIRVVCGIN